MTSTDHDIAEVARIAAGLTKAQREYMLGQLPKLNWRSEYALIYALRKLGCFEMKPAFTPLGLAVHAYLESNNAE